MRRRTLLRDTAIIGSMSVLGLNGCARSAQALSPIRARTDRIFDITVCLRPFRAAGPRIAPEQLGDKQVVHNYGHGGSGWSLSWGSSTRAVQMAMAGSPGDVAVIGCGALGLTSAILAQRAGARVTIYARELLPQTRSARATGSWTPDSRIALTKAAGNGFAATWEEMARFSFKTYRNYLGLPGTPVEWLNYYTLSDVSLDGPRQKPLDPPGFASYRQAIADLTPHRQLLSAEAAPFDAPFVYQSETMIFNIASYGHTLLSDFLAAGGTLQRAEFFSPADLQSLKQTVIINCPGYGAKTLWSDDSITPVRGQIAWLVPQPEARYGLFYNDINVISRSDGIVVQAIEGGDMKGYNNPDETPDRAEAERAVTALNGLVYKKESLLF